MQIRHHTQTQLNDISKLNIEMSIWIFTANKWIGGDLKRAECPLAWNAHNVSSSAPVGQLIMPLSHIFLLAAVVLSLAMLTRSPPRCQTPRSLRRFCKLKGALKVQTFFFLCWKSTVGASVACTLSSSFGAKGVLKDYRWGNLQGGERVAISICCKMRDMAKDPSTQLSAFLLALGTILKWCSTLEMHCGPLHWMQSNVSLPPLLRLLPHLLSCQTPYAIRWQCQC